MANTAEPLFSGTHLRAEVHNPDAEVLFVSFDHWRRARQDFPDWAASTRVAELGFAELTIRTAKNDWFVNPDLEALRECLGNFTKRYRTVRSLTFSMGGFGALLLSRALRLRRVVMVSPQWSIFPDQPPHDTRYGHEARSMDRRLADLSGVIDPKLTGVVLFDPAGYAIDQNHARLIAAHAPGLATVAMPFGGHPASGHLVDTGKFKELRDLALKGKTDPARYRELHVAARASSERYFEGVQDYMVRRLNRIR